MRAKRRVKGRLTGRGYRGEPAFDPNLPPGQKDVELSP